MRRDDASGDAMLFDAIACILLCGMMLVPLINVVVGLIFGACFGGPLGALTGLALAVFISAIEQQCSGARAPETANP
jgi:hypothetical protein